MSYEIKECPLEVVLEIRHKVMWPDKDIEYVKVTGDKTAKHLGLYIDDKVVSIISLFKDNDNVQFRKFATLKEEQGKGYGTILLNHVIDEAQREGYKTIWCNAKVNAIPFYKQFGLNETCGLFSKGNQDYTIMIREF